MSINGDDIGLEVHPNTDQFYESKRAVAWL